MSPEVQPVAVVEQHVLTINEIKSNIARIHALFKDVMKDGVHYGKIPGTGDKPTLLKPGTELVLAMLRLEAYPLVEDLSTADKVHYRVTINVKHAPTGVSLGWGVGECSTDEAKYRWRGVVCDAEYDAEDPARRRVKWFKGTQPYTKKQVRTDPADAANTILKMATKRARSDGVLTCTACSDIFQQDAEDMTAELRAEIYGDEAPPPPPPQQPGERKDEGARTDTPATAQADAQSDAVQRTAEKTAGTVITDGMLKTLKGRMKAKGTTEPAFCKQFKIGAVELLPRAQINEAFEWIDKQP